MIDSFHWINTGYTIGYEWLTKGYGGWRKLIFPAYVGLLHDDRFGYILFDTGYGSDFNEVTHKFPFRFYRWATPVFYKEENGIVSRLQKLGIKPEEIKHVYLSHFHADHIGSLRSFNQAKLYYHEDCQKVFQMTNFKKVNNGILPALFPDDLMERSVLLSDKNASENEVFGQQWTLFDDVIKAVPLPGHAIGQTGIIFDLKGTAFFLTADASWFSSVFTNQKLPHKLVSLIVDDWSNYKETVNRIYRYKKSNPETILLPSHCTENNHEFQID